MRCVLVLQSQSRTAADGAGLPLTLIARQWGWMACDGEERSALPSVCPLSSLRSWPTEHALHWHLASMILGLFFPEWQRFSSFRCFKQRLSRIKSGGNWQRTAVTVTVC